jgi:hypothetical protein
LTNVPMPPYQVYCSTRDCKNLAVYKIAARWSDGVVGELKTYGLCCADCLAEAFARARSTQQACRLAPGETLQAPGIYRHARGQRDQALERLPELEARLTTAQH